MFTLPLSQLSSVADSLGNLALVTPEDDQGYQPQIGDKKDYPPAILFNFEGQQRVILESEITDHFVEDNSTRSDNISLKSPRITVKGYIGEVNTVLPKELKILKQITDKLVIIGLYVPGVSTRAVKLYQEAVFAYQIGARVLNAGISTWSTISKQGNTQAVIGSEGLENFDKKTGGINSKVQNRQQIAFTQFYGYWQLKTLFTVQTPWAVFRNMAIVKVEPFQDRESKDVTEFSVEFKMVRTVSTEVNLGPKQSRLFYQSSPIVDNGNSSLVPAGPLSSNLSQFGVA